MSNSDREAKEGGKVLKAFAKTMEKWEPGVTHPVYAKIGARVRTVRVALGVTQEELAGRIGLTRTSIVNFESGRQQCPLHVMLQIAHALGLKPDNLFQGILNP